MLPYAYEVTKYDPADRDGQGRYAGAQDRVSDHGPVEAAYLQAVADFAAETGVRQLAIREPQVAAFVHFGLEPAIGGHGLAGLFPPDLAGYHDGAVVPVPVVLELVRAMLRENGAWCRLEVEGQLTVHVGFDQYLWVASAVRCQAALARARQAGLFPERIDASPYAFTPDPLEMQRPAGDEFWARLAWCVRTGQAAILEKILDDRHPLMTGVLPDHDGVMRARWGNPPAPSDRHWALLKDLRPGQVVTGTVTSISGDGTASVDIGGLTAMTSTPAHPAGPSRSPAAAGQHVTATVLHVDTIREQVTLTLRA